MQVNCKGQSRVSVRQNQSGMMQGRPTPKAAFRAVNIVPAIYLFLVVVANNFVFSPLKKAEVMAIKGK